MTVTGIHWQGHIHSPLTSHTHKHCACPGGSSTVPPKKGKDIHNSHHTHYMSLMVHHLLHPKKGNDIFTHTVYAPWCFSSGTAVLGSNYLSNQLYSEMGPKFKYFTIRVKESQAWNHL